MNNGKRPPLDNITSFATGQSPERHPKKKKLESELNPEYDKEALILFFKGHVNYKNYSEANKTLKLIYEHHHNNLTPEESQSLRDFYATYAHLANTNRPVIAQGLGQTTTGMQASDIPFSTMTYK